MEVEEIQEVQEIQGVQEVQGAAGATGSESAAGNGAAAGSAAASGSAGAINLGIPILVGVVVTAILGKICYNAFKTMWNKSKVQNEIIEEFYNQMKPSKEALAQYKDKILSLMMKAYF